MNTAAIPKAPATAAAQNRIITVEGREREQRVVAMGGRMQAWLLKFANLEARRVDALVERYGTSPMAFQALDDARARAPFAKQAPTRDSMLRELLAIYSAFGLQQIEASGSRWANRLGGEWVLKPEARYRYAQQIENKVVLLFRNTEQMVRDSLQTIITDAAAEYPRPSPGELRRRIARQWHGEPTREEIARGKEAEQLATAEWERRFREYPPGSRIAGQVPRVALALEHIREGEREALFSPARADMIARTELGDLDTAGALEGFAVSGVKKVAWAARPYDGRSGSREHYKMNRHKALTVADVTSDDRGRWFKLPSGARARRPLDYVLPVGERVNCRCVLLPRR